MTALATYRNVRRARRAAERLRESGSPFPFAEAFFADGATRDLLEALQDLGIVQPADLDRVPERGPLPSQAA